MNFKNWLLQTKTDEPDLSLFITKLEPFFTETGFNGLEFERKVNLGLRKINLDIDELLKPETNAENQ